MSSFGDFFFNDTATTEIYTLSYTLSLHDALPISCTIATIDWHPRTRPAAPCIRSEEHTSELQSHSEISYAVFCLKKKNKKIAIMEFDHAATDKETNENLGYLVAGLRFFFNSDFALFFFNDTATTEIYTLSYTLSLHDALPISPVTFRNLVCRLLLVTG